MNAIGGDCLAGKLDGDNALHSLPLWPLKKRWHASAHKRFVGTIRYAQEETMNAAWYTFPGGNEET
jgi:hypothetical protein